MDATPMHVGDRGNQPIRIVLPEDIATARKTVTDFLQTTLEQGSCGDVVVDFSNVPDFDDYTFAYLIQLGNKLKKSGHKLSIVGLSLQVSRVMHEMGLAPLFAIVG